MSKKTTKARTKTKSKSKTNLKSNNSSKTSFSVERVYNASITKVWNALTNIDEIRQWYFDISDFKAEKGFEFSFIGTGKDSSHSYKHLCRITEVIPNKKLAYSWQYEGLKGYSEVIFELFQENTKTRVKLTHEGLNTFPQNNQDFLQENFVEGWTSIIGDILKSYAEYKKVIVFNLVTVDGFFEGPQGLGDLSWHNVDAEFNEFAIEQMKAIDTLIFGRKTYEMMASYWPKPEVIKNDPIVAKLMNEVPKLVFASTLNEFNWSNSSLVNGDMVTTIKNLKAKANKDIFIFGSGKLTNEFLKKGLIDEIRIIINPLLLGGGTPMFKDNKVGLQLLKAKTFKNANVLLFYKVKKE